MAQLKNGDIAKFKMAMGITECLDLTEVCNYLY